MVPGFFLADKLIYTEVYIQVIEAGISKSDAEEAILNWEGNISTPGIFRCQWQVKMSFLVRRNLLHQVLTWDQVITETTLFGKG